MKKEKIINLIIPFISCLAIVALWFAVSLAVDSEYVLPNIKSTLSATVSLLKTSEFYTALFFTLLRSLIAFSVSFVIAFVLAFYSHKSHKFKRAVLPVISVIRALPTIAVVLLLLFWTSAFIAPVIVTMLVVLPTLYSLVCNSLEQIDEETVLACRLFEVKEKDIVRKVKIPTVLPDLIKSVGSGIALNLKLMVAAEVLSQTSRSIGYILNTSKVYFEISQMLATVLITVTLAVLTEFIFNKISEKVGAWK